MSCVSARLLLMTKIFSISKLCFAGNSLSIRMGIADPSLYIIYIV